MTRIVQFKRGTTAQNEVYGGLVGELTVDTDKQTLVLHDGAGGVSPMATERNAQTIINKTLSLADNTFTGIDGDGLEIVSNILNVDDTVVRTVDPQTIAGTKSFTDSIDVVGITTDEVTVPLLNANAETINFGGAATNLQIAANTGTTTVNNNLSVAGDFTVAGTFTVTEEESLVITDKNVILADSASPSDTIASGGGVILKGTTDKTLLWQIATDSWTSSEDFDLASGKSYYINNNEVLAEDTLGAGVVNSSLTGLGTVTVGTWEADTIGTEYGGTGQTTYTNGELLIGNSTGNTLTKGTLTGGTGISVTNNPGDVTLTNTDRGSSQFIFRNIADFNNINQIVASSNNDVLKLVSAGSAFLEFDSETSTVTIGAEGEAYTAGDGLNLSAENEFSVDSTVVRTSGSQTIDGTKIFVSTISGDIDGNAASASKLDPGAFINGVFFDGTQNINLPSATLEEDLIAGDGLSSSGPYNGSVERTIINADRGSDQSIFKNIQDGTGAAQFSASGNSDIIQFDAGGDLNIEFDSTNNRIKYSLTIPEGETNTAGDGLELNGVEFSVDDTVVRTFGDQTIDGVKTFVQPVELSSQATALTQAVRADREITTSNGLTGGGRLNGDVALALDSSVVRDTGNQSIAGTKTFVNTIVATSASPGIIVNEIDSTATTFSLANQNVNTINIGSDATEINIGDPLGQTNFASDVNVATGSVYRIGGSSVLSSDTLGSAITNSSLDTVGTITTGTWQGSAIQEEYGGTGQTSYTDGQILIGDTTTGGLNKTTLTAGTNISITNGSGSITIDGPFYTAGDGISRTGLEFSVAAGNGLIQEANGLALDLNDVVTIADDQTITGNKTFSNAVILSTQANSTTHAVRADRTLTAGSGLTGGGNLTADRTISHANTSSQGSVSNTGNTVIQDITLDGFGHITALSSKTIDTQSRDSLGIDTNDNVQFGSLGGGTTAPSTTGDIRATGSITAFFASDEKLKENVQEISNPLDAIDQIRGVSFDWTDEEIERQGGEDDYFVRKHTVGVIAQEIEQILPEAVATRPDGFKAVRYELLVPLLIQGMKEQQEQIKMLEEKVETLWQHR